MTISKAYDGEDVVLTINYTDDAGNAVAPDDTTTMPAWTITDTSDDTEVLSGVNGTENATGDYEYVWDTAADAAGPGTYEVEVSAEFNTGETKIQRDTITLE